MYSSNVIYLSGLKFVAISLILRLITSVETKLLTSFEFEDMLMTGYVFV
jgi:hypothetical protein